MFKLLFSKCFFGAAVFLLIILSNAALRAHEDVPAAFPAGMVGVEWVPAVAAGTVAATYLFGNETHPSVFSPLQAQATVLEKDIFSLLEEDVYNLEELKDAAAKNKRSKATERFVKIFSKNLGVDDITINKKISAMALNAQYGFTENPFKPKHFIKVWDLKEYECDIGNLFIQTRIANGQRIYTHTGMEKKLYRAPSLPFSKYFPERWHQNLTSYHLRHVSQAPLAKRVGMLAGIIYAVVEAGNSIKMGFVSGAVRPEDTYLYKAAQIPANLVKALFSLAKDDK